MSAVHHLSVAQLQDGFSSGLLTPSGVWEHYRARIDALDPALHSHTEQAGWREPAPGPLHGVPIAVKANIDVAGLDTHCGIEARRGSVATQDAEAVERLRSAGATILGSLNMHEGALGADTDNPWFGRAMNPYGEGRTPGGSSGGSGAAVAAGLCLAALGTDTLGSVRIPAAYCGVFGLKPSRGLVSQQGLELVATDLDTIGPIARSLDDLEAVFTALCDAPPPRRITHAATIESLGGVVCEPGVLQAYMRALGGLAAEGLEAENRLTLDLMPLRFAGFLHAARELGGRLADLRAGKPEGFSPAFQFLLDYPAGRTAEQAEADEALLATTRAAVIDAVGDGVLVMPTTPQVAFVHGGRAPANQADFTCLASIAGLPALSIPAGLDASGMPVAVQLVGAHGNDLGLIALARQLLPHLPPTPPPTCF